MLWDLSCLEQLFEQKDAFPNVVITSIKRDKIMIDIHLHILPGVDDGPVTMQESLDLARVLVQEGVHTAIATPHYNDEFPHLSAAEVQSRVNDLQREFAGHDIPLRLFAGHEVLIKPG